MKGIFDLLKTTFTEWNEDGAPRLAAALAYYTAFSLAPLLVVVIAVVGFVVSEDTVRSNIIQQVQATIGPDTAELVADLIDNVNQPAEGIVSALLGIGALLLGAAGVFGNLQTALDIMWDVEHVERPGGVTGFIKDKLLSFGMLLVVGFLLLVSLVLSTALSFLDTYFISLLPTSELMLRVLNFGLSWGVITLLFALIYKYLPHARIEWRDVWVGAAVTALLFSIGKTLLALYLGGSGTASAYGAAGAFVLILLWVNYSAQIVLFGAEFTQVYARKYGSRISPLAAIAELEREAETVAAAESATPETPTAQKGSALAGLFFSVGVIILGFISSRLGNTNGEDTTTPDRV